MGSEGWNGFKEAYGFKLHLLIDCETKFPIALIVTNGLASDNTLAIPLLKRAKSWLKKVGYEPHIMEVANGSCGTAEYDRETIIKLRRDEAQKAAELIGAEYHEGVVDDIEVFYEPRTLHTN